MHATGAGPAVVEHRLEPGEWDAAVAATSGPQIVVGGPGTGKSEFLVRRAAHLLSDPGVAPQEVLVLSFSRRGAAELRDRIRRAVPGTTASVDVTTFHSYCWRLLEAHARDAGWAEPPQILTGPEQVALIKELLAAARPGDWSPGMRPLLTTNTFAAEVTDFVLRVHEQLTSDEELVAAAARRQDWRGLPAFLQRYRRELDERRRIDYGGLVAAAVRLLSADGAPTPDVRFVLVDEYQDTTASQVAMLEALSRGARNVTAAADPYQSIYSFRGAALGNVADFPRVFGAGDTPVRRTILPTSFRTPAAILDAAVRITAGADLPGAAGPVTPAPTSGRVEIRVFDQQTEEAEWVAGEITRLHLSERIPLGTIGVFVRSKRRFLAELSRALHRRSLPHDEPDTAVVDQPAVRFVMDAVRAVTTAPGDPEADRAIRRLLLGPVVALPLGRMRDVERLEVREDVGWAEAIRRLVPDGAGLASLLDDSSWTTAVPAADGFWRVWTGLPQLAAMVRDPARRDERTAWTSLGQVLVRWNERNPEATLAEYVRLLEHEEFEARPLLSYRRPPGDRVTLTTLHQSKGLEFDVVFICDAVEGVFPDVRPRDSLLGTRFLLPHVPDDPAAYLAFRLQEERRLAYTAMVRARRRVVWTATTPGTDDGRGMPSRFLDLVLGDREPSAHVAEPEHTPVTRQEAEAQLRRWAADPTTAPPVRLAAVTALVRGPEWDLPAADAIPGARERGDDGGLVAPPLVLSPSQAERYELCPRRYALERRLHIGDRPSPHALFGTIVHDVLEAAEGTAAERGDDRSTLGEAQAAFDDAFAPEEFGGGAFAAAWRTRGHRLLARLYATWPAWGSVVALERHLDLDLDGTRWTGRADRIEARGGTVKVVDYKTGRSVISVADAAESLQLGYYLLAAAADPEIAAHGVPRAAEMWFPARESVGLTVRSFDPANLDAIAERLGAVAAGIRAERWDPTPGDGCERCPVRLVCPAWPEGGEAYV